MQMSKLSKWKEEIWSGIEECYKQVKLSFAMEGVVDVYVRGQLVMEYIGEAITLAQFQSRTKQYRANGVIQHYFMSPKSHEVIETFLLNSSFRFKH